VISKLLSYWTGKFKKKDNPPLFGLNSPTIQQVGYLIPLSCGHNGKPERNEIAMLAVHLELAEFNQDSYDSTAIPPFLGLA